MKLTILSLILVSNFIAPRIFAKQYNFYEDIGSYNQEQKLMTKEKQYEDKITYLESELNKYKQQLVEKSIYTEKSQEILKLKYEQEIAFLKREVIYKTKSLLEAQRQIEKINPSDDLKSLIKLNNEMAAQIRGNQDALAISKLKNDSGRSPASLKSK
jgi:ABC-type Fe3+-citrate transport system substrate-binding protein